jgi:hypothetical protein
MAVADNALFGIELLDDLQKLEIPLGEEELSHYLLPVVAIE